MTDNASASPSGGTADPEPGVRVENLLKALNKCLEMNDKHQSTTQSQETDRVNHGTNGTHETVTSSTLNSDLNDREPNGKSIPNQQTLHHQSSSEHKKETANAENQITATNAGINSEAANSTTKSIATATARERVEASQHEADESADTNEAAPAISRSVGAAINGSVETAVNESAGAVNESVAACESASDRPEEREVATESLLAQKLSVVMEKLEAYRATRDHMIALANRLREENERYEAVLESGAGGGEEDCSTSAELEESKVKHDEATRNEIEDNPSLDKLNSERRGVIGNKTVAETGNESHQYRERESSTATAQQSSIITTCRSTSENNINTCTTQNNTAASNITAVQKKSAQNEHIAASTTSMTQQSLLQCKSGDVTCDKVAAASVDVAALKSCTELIQSSSSNAEIPLQREGKHSARPDLQPQGLNTNVTKQLGDDDVDDDDDVDYDDDYYDVSEDMDYLYEEDGGKSSIKGSVRVTSNDSGEGQVKCTSILSTAGTTSTANTTSTASTTNATSTTSSTSTTSAISTASTTSTKSVTTPTCAATEDSAKTDRVPDDQEIKTSMISSQDEHQDIRNRTDTALSQTSPGQQNLTDLSLRSGDTTFTSQGVTNSRPSSSDPLTSGQGSSSRERLNLTFRLQAEIARLQLSMVEMQDRMRAATALLHRLVELECEEEGE